MVDDKAECVLHSRTPIIAGCLYSAFNGRQPDWPTLSAPFPFGSPINGHAKVADRLAVHSAMTTGQPLRPPLHSALVQPERRTRPCENKRACSSGGSLGPSPNHAASPLPTQDWACVGGYGQK